MSLVRLQPDPQRFPVGTNVSVYQRDTAYPGGLAPDFSTPRAPGAVAAAGPTAVAADGSLTFTGLTDGVQYVAVGPTAIFFFTPGGRTLAAESDSVVQDGISAAAPAAGTAIATIPAASLPRGRYRVRAATWESGTVDANARNGQVKAGAVVVGDLPSTAQSTEHETFDDVELDGATALTVNVGAAAGGAASVYNGWVEATRIG